VVDEGPTRQRRAPGGQRQPLDLAVLRGQAFRSSARHVRNANGYFKSGQNTKSRRADGRRPLASARAGGIGWEYLFKFGGGSPPWVSGLAQGTGIKVFARAGQKLLQPRRQELRRSVGHPLLPDGEAALGIFKTPPPEGVRVTRGRRGLPHLLHAKGAAGTERVTQAVVGLHDYAQLIAIRRDCSCISRATRQLRVETAGYDTAPGRSTRTRP